MKKNLRMGGIVLMARIPYLLYIITLCHLTADPQVTCDRYRYGYTQGKKNVTHE